ncbi:ribokinase [Haematococcus lacustris]|uniref:Ribokinase n=1 Tax=Haematococcus lacustris TaxID=44745 RepID=A0A699ZUR0_HAELA|nr:ribokinase [Haematococcus lacustris]
MHGRVPVKDTVGCGDSFAAAIVWGYIHGHPVGTTLALANAVGAATAMGQGAGRNVANADTDGKGLVDLTDDIRHLAGGVALSHLPDNSASMTAVKVQAIVIGAWRSVHKQLQEAPPEKLDALTAMHKEGRA